MTILACWLDNFHTMIYPELVIRSCAQGGWELSFASRANHGYQRYLSLSFGIQEFIPRGKKGMIIWLISGVFLYFS